LYLQIVDKDKAFYLFMQAVLLLCLHYLIVQAGSWFQHCQYPSSLASNSI